MGSTDPTCRLEALPSTGSFHGVAVKSDSAFTTGATIPLSADAREKLSDSSSIFSTEFDEKLIGTSLDHFEIRSLLGRGGMGSVYLAWHQRLHRLCAVKVITAELVRSDPKRLDMFYTEARSAARLIHPNIVATHSLGEDRGYHFIEMEYVEGTSLTGLVGSAGQLDPKTSTRMIGQIASALWMAHERDVIHCDVKPDNVMVCPMRHEAKLTDFGLARILARDMPDQSGIAVGTPPYMAPELFAGTPTSRESDVYALGATFFVLLTGRVPYPAQTLAELFDVVRFDPVPDVRDFVADIPEPIAACVESMLAKDPLQRPACDAALLKRLHEIVNMLVPTRELVAEAMARTNVSWTQTGEAFEFRVRLPNGRDQVVYAVVIESDKTGQCLMSFRTPCAPADPKHFGYVLEMNSRLPFGSVGIHLHNGRPYFVMVENRLRATVDPEEIRASVVHMAEWADRIELDLTGKNVH